MMEEAGKVAEPTLDAVYGPRGEAILRQLAGEWFLVPVRTSPADFRAIFTVNEIGALVWGELDGRRSLGEIAGTVVSRFDVAPEAAAEDLLTFVGQLEGAGLAERRA